MATHSSILVWKIPWTREPGRLHTVHGVAKRQSWLRMHECSEPKGCHLVIEKSEFAPQPQGFPDSSAGKESSCNAGDPGLIPGLGRSSGEGIGYPLQYSWPPLVAGKESACNVGDLVSIPGLGRSPGEGKGYPLKYTGLQFHGLYSP